MNEPNLASQVGKSYWFDLPAENVLDAMSFYEALLGWVFVRMSDPVLSDYWIIQKGEDLIGGLRKMPQPNQRKKDSDAPILYFTVEKLEPAVARAKELGAKLIGPRVELGQQRGAYQWIRDREENLMALWAPQ